MSDRIMIEILDIRSCDHFPFKVSRTSLLSEANLSDIFFVELSESCECFSPLLHTDEHKTRSERIECACVTEFAHPCLLAQDTDHVKRAHAGGLVDKEEFGKLFHMALH